MIFEIFLDLVSVYLVLGLIFAVLFITKGLGSVDEGAKGSGIGFRIILIPGTVVFWPILLKKWIQSKRIKQND